jgi:hypothetical protein
MRRVVQGIVAEEVGGQELPVDPGVVDDDAHDVDEGLSGRPCATTTPFAR